MKIRFATQTLTALNHWHRLAAWKQTALLCAFGAFLLYVPAWHYWQQRARLEQLTQQQHTQQENLNHQQKILTALKEKAAKQLLTPELAAKLPPINQQIQQLASALQIEQSRWDFHQKPLLKLNLRGHFNDLRQFLTALLTANEELELIEWHMQKTDQRDGASIAGELLLQLNRKEK